MGAALQGFCRAGPACPAAGAGKIRFGPMPTSAPTDALLVVRRGSASPAGDRKGRPYGGLQVVQGAGRCRHRPLRNLQGVLTGRRGNRRSAASGRGSEPVSRKCPDWRPQQWPSVGWRDGGQPPAPTVGYKNGPPAGLAGGPFKRLSLFIAAYHTVSRLPKEVVIGDVADGFLGSDGTLFNLLGTSVQALEIYIGDFSLVLIGADGLAKHGFITHALARSRAASMRLSAERPRAWRMRRKASGCMASPARTARVSP